MLHESANLPVADEEAVDKIADLIEADSPLMNSFVPEGASAVHRHHREAYDGADAVPDRMLVVRSRSDVGARPDSMDGTAVHPIQVMSDSAQTILDGAKDPYRWHVEVHRRIATVLLEQFPSFTDGTVQSPIRRSVKPTSPRLDSASGRLFSTAIFSLATSP